MTATFENETLGRKLSGVIGELSYSLFPTAKSSSFPTIRLEFRPRFHEYQSSSHEINEMAGKLSQTANV
jgi:hypothetical protein